MPIEFDGPNSKVSANTIEAQTGSTITIQSGHNLSGGGSGLTALNGSNIASGTVADARISALTASKLTGALPAISGASLTGISSGPTLGTLVTPTPAGSATFSSIPSGTTNIIVSFNEISTASVTSMQVQLGDAGGVESTGYAATSVDVSSSTSTLAESSTTGHIVSIQGSGRLLAGHMFLTLLDASSNLWISSHTAKLANDRMVAGGGSKALSAELTQIYFLLGAGSYDAGSMNIMYW